MKPIIVLSLGLAACGQLVDDAASGGMSARALEQRMAVMPTPDRIAFYEAMIRQNPADSKAQVHLANTYVQRMRETTDYGFLDRAGQILDKVLKADPENYEALRVQNEVDLFRHNFANVAERSHKLASRDPKDAVNFATLGDALMETGQYDAAADAYQQTVNLRPDLMSFNRVGWWRFVTGDMDGAIEMMTKAVRSGHPRHENTAWCLVELGNLYFKSGSLSEAEAAYRTALQHFAAMHSAYAGLGYIFAAQGKLDEAAASLRKAQAMAPLPDYAGGLAGIAAVQGKPDEVKKQLQMLEAVAKMEAAVGQKANRQIGLIFANHSYCLDEAMEMAKEDLALRKDVFTWDAYSWVLFRAGNADEAAKASEQALRAGTPEPLFYFHAGMIAKERGDAARARTMLERALALNAEFDVLHAREARKALKELRE